MNALRILIALLYLACSAAAFAQIPVRIIVPYPPAGLTDFIARALALELTTTLGRQVIIDNRAGNSEFFTEFIARIPADGNWMFVTNAPRLIERLGPVVDRLVPVAAIIDETTPSRWVGVFAPLGTPASIVRDFERAVIAAINSPGFRQKASEIKISNTQVGFVPTYSDGASLARLVAQSVSGRNMTASPSTQADDPKAVGGAYRP